jgi:SAM-dependent methyltransferase
MSAPLTPPGAGIAEAAGSLALSARALAALAAALGERAEGRTLPPALGAPVADALDALGLRDAADAADGVALRALLGSIRTELFLCARLAAGHGEGQAGGTWDPTEPAVMQAAGEASAAFPGLLARSIAPRLEGLAARLEAPGAAFLDVGVGVAALAVEMARRWPSLRVLGIDPWPPALAIARAQVRRAGLGARIALRWQRGQDLREEARFDLAWVPGAFIPAADLPAVLHRAARALRPAGWLLLATAATAPGDALAAALGRLRVAAWGGAEATPEAVARLLDGAGLASVTALPRPPGSAIAVVAGRAPGADPGAWPAERGADYRLATALSQ